MLIVRRLVGYAATFLIGVMLAALTGWLGNLDHLVYRAVYLDPDDEVTLNDDIVLVDLPHMEDDSDRALAGYRARVADLLRTIAAAGARPEVVVLDIWFERNEDGIEAIEAGIEAVASLHRDRYPEDVPVLRALHLKGLGDGPIRLGPESFDYETVMREHQRSLYHQSSLYAHTLFSEAVGVLAYESAKTLRSPDQTISVDSMAVRVATWRNENFEPSRDAFVLPIGPQQRVVEQSVSFLHEPGATEGGRFTAPRQRGVTGELTERPPPAFGDKIVVIGSLLEDCRDCTRPGPELVAWSISDQLAATSAARAPLDHMGLLLLQTGVFGLLTALTYALLFKYVKALQTKPVWLAALSIAIALALLVAWVGIVLTRGTVVPVGLTGFAILLAGILSAAFAYRFLVTGVAEGSGRYDVFVSYSHGHSAWVREHVVGPLQRIRKPDGSPLEIFYDRKSIAIGEVFTAKYMWGIVDSKAFVPVFSPDYAKKNHCQNEMELAFRRRVEAQLEILPVVDGGEVPEIYRGLTYVDTAQAPDFMEDLERRLLAVLAEREPGDDAA